MEAKSPRNRKFEALFDGDEVEGKRYALGDIITGLDAPTAEYLLKVGRIAEVDSDETDEPAETDEERAAREEAEADHERLEAAHAAFAAGNIPADLIDADKADDADDRLIGKDALIELAKAAEAVIKSSMTKAEIAQAIMAARAKAEANADAEDDAEDDAGATS